MPGAADPILVRAREVLLDALDALEPHLDHLVLIGAQAVYQHTGDADLTIAPFTQDADLALDPRQLESAPLIESCLSEAGFVQGVTRQPGCWYGRDGVEVDLMVPQQLAGEGRRSAEIPPHDKFAARRAAGIEAVVLDNDWHELASLAAESSRKHRVRVAGPAALLVAKTTKLHERAAGSGSRIENKDALDIYRLLRTTPSRTLADRLTLLSGEDLSRDATVSALASLEMLFVAPGAIGATCLRAALKGSEEVETAPVQARFLTEQLLRLVRDEQ